MVFPDLFESDRTGLVAVTAALGGGISGYVMVTRSACNYTVKQYCTENEARLVLRWISEVLGALAAGRFSPFVPAVDLRTLEAEGDAAASAALDDAFSFLAAGD